MVRMVVQVSGCEHGKVDVQKVFGPEAKGLVAHMNTEGQHRGAVAAAKAAAAAKTAKKDSHDHKHEDHKHADHDDHDHVHGHDCEQCNEEHHHGSDGHEHKHDHSHDHGHNNGHKVFSDISLFKVSMSQLCMSQGQVTRSQKLPFPVTYFLAALSIGRLLQESETDFLQHDHEHGHKHEHKRQETTAAARFGIISFVYSRRRPFHPQRSGIHSSGIKQPPFLCSVLSALPFL